MSLDATARRPLPPTRRAKATAVAVASKSDAWGLLRRQTTETGRIDSWEHSENRIVGTAQSLY